MVNEADVGTYRFRLRAVDVQTGLPVTETTEDVLILSVAS